MTASAEPRRVIGRVAGAPLWAHGATLLIVLVAVLPVVGTGASYSADEGAAIIEARSLADGHGWIIPHPFPELDPTGEMYPLELSTSGPEGTASYAKHPAYPWLLSFADRVGGQSAMVGLSLLGTWIAALGAAVLARHLAGGLARTTLWLAGAGSPLLFNGYWVIAHSLAAAALAWAVVAVVASVRGAASVPWRLLVAAPILVAIAALLRTEAVIYGGALGASTIVVGAQLRRPRVVALGVAVGVAGLLARVVDSTLAARIVGEPVISTNPFFPRDRGGGLVNQRIDGFVNTWLRAGPTGVDASSVRLVLIAALLTAGAAVALRLALTRPAVVFAGSAAVLLTVRAIAEPALAIPGLLIAFPILFLGVLGATPRPSVTDARAAGLLLGVVGLGWAGVLATQYAEGGTAEWGGRYFAIGLPLVIPLVVVAARPLLARVPARAGRLVVGAVAISLLSLSIASLREMRAGHHASEEVFTDVAQLAARAGPRAVIVTDRPALPRLDWAGFDEHRWLLARPDKVPDLPQRLADLGVSRWVLVVGDPDAALEAFPSVRVVERASPHILLVELAP